MKLEASRFIAASYFDFGTERAKHGSIGTSKKLFSKYPGRPSASQLASALLQAPTSLRDPLTAAENGAGGVKSRAALIATDDMFRTKLMSQWRMQLMAGSNLALYGYGSKALLLSLFIQEHAQPWHVFRMRGYERGASLADLLTAALQVFDPAPGRTSSSGRRLGELSRRLVQMAKEPVLLVIEMADAPALRSPEVWKCLGRLASSSPGLIRLLLTFEHVNCLLLAEGPAWARLNLIWHDATTLLPYSAELAPLLAGGVGAADEESRWRGAHFVLSSLTKTARAVFRVLAEHQLRLDKGSNSNNDDSPMQLDAGDDENDHTIVSDRDDDDDDDDNDDDDEDEGGGNEEERRGSRIKGGLSVVAWYQKCQEQFLVSNEIAFRTQLTEFVDHELVRAVDEAAGQNGTEFYISLSAAHIQKLLDICK